MASPVSLNLKVHGFLLINIVSREPHAWHVISQYSIDVTSKAQCTLAQDNMSQGSVSHVTQNEIVLNTLTNNWAGAPQQQSRPGIQ